MAYPRHQPTAKQVWALAAAQDDVISRDQLLALGFHPQAIKHRVARGKLHPLWPGVFAVGSPNVSVRGRWRAALITCGPQAWLSHVTGAAHFGLRESGDEPIEVSIPASVMRPREGIRVHRRKGLVSPHVGQYSGLPVTSPTLTLADLAGRSPQDELELMIKEADVRDLISPTRLRLELDAIGPRPGVGRLKRILDRHTFVLTASELERCFVPIAHAAGLPTPLTGRSVNGFEVDFFWPELGLVVETDGLRYHRTPAQQTRDRLRDQAHTAAGLLPLRFTHAQVRYDADYVQATLRAVAVRQGRRG